MSNTYMADRAREPSDSMPRRASMFSVHIGTAIVRRPRTDMPQPCRRNQKSASLVLPGSLLEWLNPSVNVGMAKRMEARKEKSMVQSVHCHNKESNSEPNGRQYWLEGHHSHLET